MVPDGLEYNPISKTAIGMPSFVYRAVLDEVVARFSNERVVLAPANNFKGPLYEQEAALRYLKKSGVDAVCPPTSVGGYIDTRGNAKLLREWFESVGEWPLGGITLVAAHLHARRAKLCFKKEGYLVEDCIPVHYKVDKNSLIVPRLWYYKSTLIHSMYEKLAFLYDFSRHSRL